MGKKAAEAARKERLAMKTEVSISERLKDLRVERKLNLEELAELTGISKSALGSYELDTPREMNHKNLIALADFYEVSVDYLLGRTENRSLPSAPLSELRLSDATVELLKSGSINNRLLCELVTHEKFAELLADVYINMTRGQNTLVMPDVDDDHGGQASGESTPAIDLRSYRLPVLQPNEQELAAHEAYLDEVDKASGGKTIWRVSENVTQAVT